MGAFAPIITAALKSAGPYAGGIALILVIALAIRQLYLDNVKESDKVATIQGGALERLSKQLNDALDRLDKVEADLDEAKRAEKECRERLEKERRERRREVADLREKLRALIEKLKDEPISWDPTDFKDAL